MTILVVSIAVINAGYGFVGSFQPLAGGAAAHQDRWVTGTLATLASNPRIGALPVPLPRDYLRGIFEIESHYRGTHRESYLRGEWRHEGWWYYYLYGLFVKLPLGTWLVLGAACVSSFAGRRFAGDWKDEMVLLVPVLHILCFVTSVTAIQNHVRYVLPVLPFLLVFASKAYWGRTFAVIAVAGTIWSATSSLAVYPHNLSYFNEFAGGPGHGHYHLDDSNVSWGQDLLYLKQWLAEHGEAKPFYLAHFGLVDPAVLDIAYESPPHFQAKSRPEPGWYAVDVNFLHKPPFDWFLGAPPVARAGYSTYIYHIGAREAATPGDRDRTPR